MGFNSGFKGLILSSKNSPIISCTVYSHCACYTECLTLCDMSTVALVIEIFQWTHLKYPSSNYKRKLLNITCMTFGWGFDNWSTTFWSNIHVRQPGFQKTLT